MGFWEDAFRTRWHPSACIHFLSTTMPRSAGAKSHTEPGSNVAYRQTDTRLVALKHQHTHTQ